MTHPNSTAAHKQLSGDRHAAVLECYQQHGPLTDRQVAKLLGSADPNASRPRITELCENDGPLEEIGHTTDELTGRKVRVVFLRKKESESEKVSEQPFCNCTFAGHLKRVQSQKRKGYVAVVCTNPVHGKPVFYGYQPAGER